MLSIGAQAPNFTGATDSGGIFHLAEWLGSRHVVLYLYVRDFTRG